jgi:hypothetical protein
MFRYEPQRQTSPFPEVNGAHWLAAPPPSIAAPPRLRVNPFCNRECTQTAPASASATLQ